MITNGALDEEIEQPLGADEVPKGIRKCYNDFLYDQTQIDAYSCTVVATYTALSNLSEKAVPYSLMKKSLDRMAKDGKFKPGFGALLSDGVKYALEDFNAEFRTKYKANRIYLSASSIYNALGKSPVVTGVKYGKGFVADTQDNAWIDGSLETVKGSQGHAITIVKINTEDDHLVKFANSYAGKLAKNVVGVDFEKYRTLFFNTGYFFTV